jgi:hypothetical protein
MITSKKFVEVRKCREEKRGQEMQRGERKKRKQLCLVSDATEE